VLLKCEKNDGIVVHVPWRWQPKIELSISFWPSPGTFR
jgi:hypothetical protein